MRATLDSTVMAFPDWTAIDLTAVATEPQTAFVLFAEQLPDSGPIVCAIDASPGSRCAAQTARALAAGVGAELLFAHAPGPRRRFEPTDPPDARRLDARTRQAAVRAVIANARRVDGRGRVETVPGPATVERRLLDFARERRARLLVASALQAGAGVEAWLSAASAARAPCPVIIVSTTPARLQRRIPSARRHGSDGARIGSQAHADTSVTPAGGLGDSTDVALRRAVARQLGARRGGVGLRARAGSVGCGPHGHAPRTARW